MSGDQADAATPGLTWPNEQPVLRASRHLLRPWRDSDAQAVFTACQDAAIQRFTTVPAPYLRKHASGFITMAGSKWRSRTGCLFAVVDASDEVMGSCGIVAVDAKRRWADVGYWVAPCARGQGAASNALIALSAWALREGGFATLELAIEPSNQASLAVAAKSGYTREPALSWEEHRGTKRAFTIWQRRAIAG